MGLAACSLKRRRTPFLYLGSLGFQFFLLSARTASISSMDFLSPLMPMMFNFLSSTSISIRSPSSTRAMGPPSTASGLQCPITGPVEAPEKRPSVMRAMLFPSSLSLLMASEV